MKKIFAFLMVSIIIVSNISYAQNATTPVTNTNVSTTQVQTIKFKDLPDSHWAKSSIDTLVSLGLLKGYEDGTVRPDGSITRAEFVTMINSMMKYKLEDKKDDESNTAVVTKNFKDVDNTAWYYQQVLIAKQQGYIAGFGDDTFRPAENITKEQVCVVLSKVMGLANLPIVNLPKDEVSSWAKPYVNQVLANMIMPLDKDGNFNATQKATRADVANAIANYAKNLNQTAQNQIKKEEPKKEKPKKEEPKKEQTTSGGGGGGGGGVTTTTTKQPPTQEQVNTAVINIIEDMENAKKKLDIKSTLQVQYLTESQELMKAYTQNNSNDIKNQLLNKKDEYSPKLTTAEKEDLKEWVGAYIGTDDLNILQEKFDFKL